MDALILVDTATERRVAAAWSELDASVKLGELGHEVERRVRIDRVHVSGRLAAVHVRRRARQRVTSSAQAGGRARFAHLLEGRELRGPALEVAPATARRVVDGWARTFERLPVGEWTAGGSISVTSDLEALRRRAWPLWRRKRRGRTEWLRTGEAPRH